MEIGIRRAHPEDALYLTSISFGAKRHWNYTEEYLALWHEQLTITEDYINSSVVFVAQKGNTIIGYCSIIEATPENMEELGFEQEGYWLNHIYIRPAYIRNGIGTKLIEQVQVYCREHDMHLLRIESDMNANGFFENLGAKYIKDIPLDGEGHIVCLYEYEIKNAQVEEINEDETTLSEEAEALVVATNEVVNQEMNSDEENDQEDYKVTINDIVEEPGNVGEDLIEKGLVEDRINLIKKETEVSNKLNELEEEVEISSESNESEEEIESVSEMTHEDILLKSYQPVDLVSQEEIIALIQEENLGEVENTSEEVQEESEESLEKDTDENIVDNLEEDLEESVEDNPEEDLKESVEDNPEKNLEEDIGENAEETREIAISSNEQDEMDEPEIEDYFSKPLNFSYYEEDPEARRIRLEREVLEQKFQELDKEDDEQELFRQNDNQEMFNENIAETATDYVTHTLAYNHLITDNELREDLQEVIDRRLNEEKEKRKVINQLEAQLEVTEDHVQTEKEKMLAGEFYIDWGDELAEDKCRAKKLLKELNSIDIEDKKQFSRLVHMLFGSVGEYIHIEPDFKCKFGTNIYIGDNFYADYNCVILDNGKVTIGNNCILSPQVGIYTLAYPTEVDKRVAGYEYTRPVTIGNDVWIGGGSQINPGVTIGNNVVVSPGSVVCTDVPDNVMVAGNPAKIIRNL